MTISRILGAESKTNVRQPLDFYATPPECTRALARVEMINWHKTIWDPCAGNGAIVDVLQGMGYWMIGTDLTDGHDFLKTTRKRSLCIVTNPPYRYATEFIRHAHTLGIPYHAWLLKADFLNAIRGLRLVDEIGYPARIHAMTWRPDFLGQGAPTMNCSWYIWSGRRRTSASFRLLSVEDRT